jgi:hypothetical protein
VIETLSFALGYLRKIEKLHALHIAKANQDQLIMDALPNRSEEIAVIKADHNMELLGLGKVLDNQTYITNLSIDIQCLICLYSELYDYKFTLTTHCCCYCGLPWNAETQYHHDDKPAHEFCALLADGYARPLNERSALLD